MLKLRRPIAFALTCVGALAFPAISLLPTAAAQEAEPPAAPPGIATVTCDPVEASAPAPEPTLLSFDAQVPERIIDTRNEIGGVDEPLDAGCTLRIDMSEIGPDTAEVAAFALSVTVISPDLGFFTAFPCAAGQPGTSSVNAREGVPTPNLVVGVPDADGMLCLFSQNGGNVVIDVSGWWETDVPDDAPEDVVLGPNRFTPIEPTRAYDTRTLENPVKLPANAVRDIEIAGVVVPDDAVSITLNVAAVAPESNGFLVVYPCGFPVPLASNLNFVAGERRAVSAIVDLGPQTDPAARGRLCVSGNATTHFLVDVTGYNAPSADTSPDVVIEPVADTRIVDTRISSVPGTRFTPRSTQRFDLSDVIERPDDALAVVLNAVAARAEDESFLSITPCTPGTPTTSSLNYDLDQTANLVVTALTPDTEICVFADTAVDVVIDLVGVVSGPPGSLINQFSFTEVDGTLAPLDQNFAIDGFDYSTRCDGDRSLGLRLGLAPRVTATVNGVVVPERDPVAPDLPIPLTPDELLTVELTRGSDAVTYYVRCLPADFPVPIVEASNGAAPGWYLTNLATSDPDLGDFLAIFNERGVPVWYQRLDEALIDAKLNSVGDIVAATNPRAFTTDPTEGHRLIELDGTLVDVQVGDDVEFPVDKHDYVEIPALPEGRAIISYPLVEGFDLTDLNPGYLNRGPAPLRCPASVVDIDQPIVDGVIRELRADDGDVTDLDDAPDLLFEWAISDHFGVDEVQFPLCFGNYSGDVGEPGEVDIFHINSLSRVEEPDCELTCDYIVGARHLDAVIRVNRAADADFAEGQVEWILSSLPSDPGDPGYVENDSGAPRLEIIGDDLGGPLRMHDAILDGTTLTMHDNRSSTDQSSRFVQYEIDEVALTATLIRQIDAPFGLTSGALGSARLADDGSVLMAWGALQPVFVEYDAEDNVLLQIAFDGGENSYRIVKYPVDTFDPDELRETAGNIAQAPTP